MLVCWTACVHNLLLVHITTYCSYMLLNWKFPCLNLIYASQCSVNISTNNITKPHSLCYSFIPITYARQQSIHWVLSFYENNKFAIAHCQLSRRFATQCFALSHFAESAELMMMLLLTFKVYNFCTINLINLKFDEIFQIQPCMKITCSNKLKSGKWNSAEAESWRKVWK